MIPAMKTLSIIAAINHFRWVMRNKLILQVSLAWLLNNSYQLFNLKIWK